MRKGQLIKALEGIDDNADIRFRTEGMEQIYSIDEVKRNPTGAVYLYCEDTLDYDDVISIANYILDNDYSLPEDWIYALSVVADLKTPWLDLGREE